jgi:hypothetical protein
MNSFMSLRGRSWSSLAPPARAGVPEAISRSREGLLRPDKNIRDGIGKSTLLATLAPYASAGVTWVGFTNPSQREQSLSARRQVSVRDDRDIVRGAKELRDDRCAGHDRNRQLE